MTSKIKLIESIGLGVAAAALATVPPLLSGSGIPPSQVVGMGVAATAVVAVAIVATKPNH